MVEVSALIDPRMFVEIETVAYAGCSRQTPGLVIAAHPHADREYAIIGGIAAVAQLVEQRTLIRRSWVRAPAAA